MLNQTLTISLSEQWAQIKTHACVLCVFVFLPAVVIVTGRCNWERYQWTSQRHQKKHQFKSPESPKVHDLILFIDSSWTSIKNTFPLAPFSQWTVLYLFVLIHLERAEGNRCHKGYLQLVNLLIPLKWKKLPIISESENRSIESIFSVFFFISINSTIITYFLSSAHPWYIFSSNEVGHQNTIHLLLLHPSIKL